MNLVQLATSAGVTPHSRLRVSICIGVMCHESGEPMSCAYLGRVGVVFRARARVRARARAGVRVRSRVRARVGARVRARVRARARA